jgi:hypothetical protein
MDALSIIGVALGVGVIVYALSLRSPDEPIQASALPPAPGSRRSPAGRLRHRSAGSTGTESGFGREPAPLARDPEPESFVYVPVLHSTGPKWRTRVGGVIGLLALVTVAALAVAVGIYQVGHILNGMVEGYLGK